MPTNLWGGLGGPSAYAFDTNPHTWSSAIGLGSTAAWTTGAPVELGTFHVDWHYGGPWLQNGGPGSPSGAAGPFKLQGSDDGSTWHDVVIDTNPVATWGASYPGDFSGDYVVDPPVTYTYWRWTNTSAANNDWYLLAAYAPDAPPPPPDPEVIITIDGVAFTQPLGIEVRAELNAPGAGFVTLSKGDVQATAANLARGNICSVTIPEIDPDPIFEWILEDGDLDVVSSDEEGGKELRFSGPGTLAILRRCIIDAVEYEDGIGYPKPNLGYWEFGEANTEGHILNKLLREATSGSRPQNPLAGVTWDFDSVNDSNGDPWGDQTLEGKWRIPIGSDLLTEVTRLVAAGLLSVEMKPGLILSAYRTRGTDRTSTTYAAGKVRFTHGVYGVPAIVGRAGDNISAELVKSQAGRDFASHALVSFPDPDGTGIKYDRTPKDGSWPYVHEVFIATQGTNSLTAKRIARGQMGWLEGAQDAPQFSHVVPWPGHGPDEDAGVYLPGQDWTENGKYWLGDTVTIHTGTGELDYDNADGLVYAITLRLDETGFLDEPIVECNGPYGGQGSGLPSAPTVAGTGGGLGGGSSSGGGSSGSPTPTDPLAIATWKQAVRVATTGNITISTGLNAGDTIDGVTLAAGDRVLVKDQSTGSQNGIYIAGSSPARASDFDEDDEVRGSVVYVIAGTTNAATAWKVTNTAVPDVGTDAITFASFGSGGGSLTIEDEGTPLATSASTLDFVGAGVAATGTGAEKTITISEPDAAAHVADTSDAHDASAVSFDPTGLTQTSATDVQEAIEDLDAAIDGIVSGGTGNVSGTVITATSDTHLDSASATTNNNSADPMIIGGDPTDSSFSRPVLLGFDVSSLAGKTIIRAELRLHRTNADTNALTAGTQFLAHRVLRAVNFAQTTWNVYSTGNNWGTVGARGGADISATRHHLGAMGTTTADVLEMYVFDVAALLQECIDAGDSTAIWRLQYNETEVTANATRWSTKDDASAFKRPKIAVLYT